MGLALSELNRLLNSNWLTRLDYSHTALQVLAHGRRWFRLNSSGSDTCLLPCVGASGEGEGEEEEGLPNLERRATVSLQLLEAVE